jgi:hypothetical protein
MHMIYRVHIYTGGTGSEGYEYFGSKRETSAFVQRLRRQGYEAGDIEVTSAPVPKTKAGVVGLLRLWGSHPDNG